MKFVKEHSKNYYLGDTTVSNVFIAEHLPEAPGNHVRVFLYALMHTELGRILTNESLAKTLGLNIEDVMAAWSYFESCGVIRKIYPNPNDKLHYDVVFADLRGKVFGGNPDLPDPDKPGRSPLDRSDLSALFRDIELIGGRPLSPSDLEKISDLLDAYDIEPALISFAWQHGVSRGKSSTAYICGIVRDWGTRGIRTAEQAADWLEQSDLRHEQYKIILKAVGLSTKATDEEKRILNRWLDDYGLSVDDILSAARKAAGKQNKFDYVKAIIEKEQAKRNGGFESDKSTKTRGGREQFYKGRRRAAESAATSRRGEVYEKLPDMQAVEQELQRLSIERASAAFSGADNKRSAVEKIERALEQKADERKALLKSGGFPPNYMDIVYSCTLCKDEGELPDGTACSCYEFERRG